VAGRRMAVDATKAGVRTEPAAASIRRARDAYSALTSTEGWPVGEACVTLTNGRGRSKVIVFTPADSATDARTRRAKTQVSTAFGVIFLLISGLGVRFPRGAQTASEQGKRCQLRIMAGIRGVLAQSGPCSTAGRWPAQTPGLESPASGTALLHHLIRCVRNPRQGSHRKTASAVAGTAPGQARPDGRPWLYLPRTRPTPQ
jgi:hypothetical protein